jgi:hypothetical protein
MSFISLIYDLHAKTAIPVGFLRSCKAFSYNKLKFCQHEVNASHHSAQVQEQRCS